MVVGAAITCKHRIEYIKNEKPLFGQVMVEAALLGVLVPLFMSPFANLLEYRKKAEYLTSWTDYQVKDYKLSYKYCTKCYLFIKMAYTAG